MVLPAPGQVLLLLLLVLLLPPTQGVVVVVVVLDTGEPHLRQRWVVKTVWVHILAASSVMGSRGVGGGALARMGWV